MTSVELHTDIEPKRNVQGTETVIGSTRSHSRRALLTCSLLVLLSVFTTSTFASPLPSPSAGSWWDGMNFDNNIESDAGASALPFSNEPAIQIPCGLIVAASKDQDEVMPLSTMIDTSLSVSTIQSSALQRYPSLQSLVRRRTSKEDDSQQLFLPVGTLNLRMGSVEATTAAPAILVVHDDDDDEEENAATNFELRLGLDFLRAHGAVLELDEEELKLQLQGSSSTKDERVVVPFIRPRASLDFGNGDGTEL